MSHVDRLDGKGVLMFVNGKPVDSELYENDPGPVTPISDDDPELVYQRKRLGIPDPRNNPK